MVYNPQQRQQGFTFDGGAATFWGTALLAALVSTVTLGFLYPFSVVLMERWRAKHSLIDGRRLVFTGSALKLFGNWIKWWFLTAITLGIYGFWVIPQITKWKWEHTEFEPTVTPVTPVATYPRNV